MPHQCVRCGTMYEDGAKEILVGCSSCSSKLFFFIRKDKFDEIQKKTVNLNKKERQQIEDDIYDLVGGREKEDPVVLDLESIRVLKPGKYELDLVNLFNNQPLVYKLEEGKYMVDVVETFKKAADEKKKKGKKK